MPWRLLSDIEDPYVPASELDTEAVLAAVMFLAMERGGIAVPEIDAATLTFNQAALVAGTLSRSLGFWTRGDGVKRSPQDCATCGSLLLGTIIGPDGRGVCRPACVPAGGKVGWLNSQEPKDAFAFIRSTLADQGIEVPAREISDLSFQEGLRVARGLEQHELADLAGVEPTAVYYLERREYDQVSIGDVQKIAGVLGCDIGDITQPEISRDVHPPDASIGMS